ncbi:MAG: hypothetical protein ACYCVY_03595 [Acidiferrobacteraceae bacterium]
MKQLTPPAVELAPLPPDKSIPARTLLPREHSRLHGPDEAPGALALPVGEAFAMPFSLQRQGRVQRGGGRWGGIHKHHGVLKRKRVPVPLKPSVVTPGSAVLAPTTPP